MRVIGSAHAGIAPGDLLILIGPLFGEQSVKNRLTGT
jgi:hypothetical protein